MGMKTAAGWLGNTWSVQTTALEEPVERFYKFDLQYVLDNDLKELPYTETPCPIQDHYTIITISAPTKNSPSSKSLEKIKIELASIYRQSLRAHEMDLYVYGDPLSFEEYPILEAPFARTPDKKSIYWKKDIDFKFGKYRATGFIAILREINNTQNGLVLLRRGRVIVGAETDDISRSHCLALRVISGLNAFLENWNLMDLKYPLIRMIFKIKRTLKR